MKATFGTFKKEIIIESKEDVSKLPTNKTKGTFLPVGSAVNETVGIGSIAYTADLSYMVALGFDEQWHEIIND